MLPEKSPKINLKTSQFIKLKLAADPDGLIDTAAVKAAFAVPIAAVIVDGNILDLNLNVQLFQDIVKQALNRLVISLRV